MNYEIIGKQSSELEDINSNKLPLLLLIMSILFIPAAYVIAAAILIKVSVKNSLKRKLNLPTTLLYAYIAIGLISSEYKIISVFFGMLIMLCAHSFNIFSTYFPLKDLSKVKKYLYIISLLVFLYGIFQFINPNFIIPAKWIDTTEYNLNKRIYSTFFNPNVFGFYLNFIILLACESLNIRKLNLEWSVFFSAIICLVLTFSRTAWISLIITLIIAGFINKKYFKYALIVAVIIFSSDLLLGSGRIDPTKAINDSSLIYRFQIWKASIEIIRDNFISGIGFGTLFMHIGDYTNSVSINIEHNHSMYLQIFTETGILGFAIFTYYLISIFKYFNDEFTENQKHLLAPITILIMTLIHGLADSVALTPQIMMILSIYSGIIKSTIKRNKSSIDC